MNPTFNGSAAWAGLISDGSADRTAPEPASRVNWRLSMVNSVDLVFDCDETFVPGDRCPGYVAMASAMQTPRQMGARALVVRSRTPHAPRVTLAPVTAPPPRPDAARRPTRPGTAGPW